MVSSYDKLNDDHNLQWIALIQFNLFQRVHVCYFSTKADEPKTYNIYNKIKENGVTIYFIYVANQY